ncbi:glycoside hydrolase family 9 protein [Phenylobacterium deserti]|uniref:Endoglucanase n=1 Tax=Phenylobacterium deserti TaxID=1914756 RepID=A0A328ACQ8_9CAUL|nr:glycoside hydrolase family 9 protein [Phenylobacterium deserti]RAK52441.1 glycosyl hydrolase [Phenylobacterium deserti]
MSRLLPRLLAAASVLAASSALAAEPAASPIRFNQLGFAPDAPKLAVVADSASAPLSWRLVDGRGRTQASGRTEVVGADSASGEHLHRIDFSGVRTAGDGFKLVVGQTQSRPFAIQPARYERLKFDALGYFYENRAAVPIEPRFVSRPDLARPAGHPSEKLTCFSGKDNAGNTWPGCDYTLDVTGGWYDAGDHGKYVVNAGVSVWTLLNAYERLAPKGSPFADGRGRIPEAGNGVDDLLDETRVELEFLLRMQVPQGKRLSVPVGAQGRGKPLVFSPIDAGGMAHLKAHDQRWTGLPMRPDKDPETRFLYGPTTSATLNLAAAAAQCGRIWRTIDPAFAERCLGAARSAYAAAKRNPEVYALGDFAGGGGYGDSKLADEFFWAASELYATTGEAAFLADLKGSSVWTGLPQTADDIAWPAVATAGLVTLAARPGGLDAADQAKVRSALVANADRALADGARQGYRLPYAPEGYPWGSNSTVLNRALVLAVVADLTGEARYKAGVVDAMDYVLGRNPLDRSFVSGHGARPMRNPHHRFWAHQMDPAFPLPPPGALSGGPNSTSMGDPVALELKGKCAPLKCWADDTRAYALNEVAINWNAPLVWVAAWLDRNGG